MAKPAANPVPERVNDGGQQQPGRCSVSSLAPGMTALSIPMPDDANLNVPTDAAAAPRRDSSLQHLTTRAAGGDEGAFAALHQRLGGGLFRLFLDRTGGRSELADDFSQKTWVAVWQALIAGKYDPARAAISTFVYAVGYRVWLQHMRSTGRANAPRRRGCRVWDRWQPPPTLPTRPSLPRPSSRSGAACGRATMRLRPHG